MSSDDTPNPSPRLAWGAAAIGKVIGKNARAVHHLAATGRLPVRKVGGQIVGEESELLAAILNAPLAGCRED